MSVPPFAFLVPRRTVALVVAVVAFVSMACGSSGSKTTAPAAGGSSTTTGSSTTGALQGTKVAVAHTSLGQTLVDAAGFTLYHFDADKPGKIACTSGCVSLWPPVLVTGTPSGAGLTGLGTVSRPDGGTQLTYQGMPVYRYAMDTAPGDTKGDGFAGLWHATIVAAAQTGASTTTGGKSGY